MAFVECRIDAQLFHYTTEAAFWAIVEGKSIWFSDLRESNDPREIRFGAERLATICSRVLDRFVGDSNYGFFQQVFHSTLGTIEKLDAFSLSLSRRCDSIPMWRSYTSEGSGVCFSMRERALKDFPCRIQEVLYLQGTQEGDDIVNLLSALVSKTTNSRFSLGTLESIELSTALLSYAIGSKDVSWDYEQEVRCVYTQVPDKGWLKDLIPVSMLPNGKTIGFRFPEERTGVNGPVRYLPMQFGKFTNGAYYPHGAIQSVILGPKHSNTPEAVSDRLQSLGYFGLTVSRSPLDWR